MVFSEYLDDYMNRIGCTNRELSRISDISAETIGRYRNGSRKPRKPSIQLNKLINALIEIAAERKPELDTAIMSEVLSQSLDESAGADNEDDAYLTRVLQLLELLQIRNNYLARELKYDPSYISRILTGKRRISNTEKLTEDISMIAARKACENHMLPQVAQLIGTELTDSESQWQCAESISQWLCTGTDIRQDAPFRKFIHSLDAFDLDEYIRILRFDHIRIPTVPFHLPSSRKYTGLNEMMECELNFIKATVTSKSMEDVIIYSEMPMEEMAKDPDFPKKWMLGTVMMLKKGLHINMIHQINRPFSEMMLGLESYIPMYMTGQISPYYLNHTETSYFLHHLKVSGAAALSGEAIDGYFNDGRYYLTYNKEELKYYWKRARQLLSKAKPLMEIYNTTKKQEFMDFLDRSYSIRGPRRYVFSSLPVFTLSDDLVERIVRRYAVSSAIKIKDWIYYCRKKITGLLNGKNEVTLVISPFSKEDFDKHPPGLSIPELFLETDMTYSYEEYLEHLELTRQFAVGHPQCRLVYNQSPAFRNINITMIDSKLVIVSKNKSPAIHFVIHHHRMIEAFQNFSPPISG